MSMGSWQGGGVGINPREQVFVAMLFPSLGHFLDLLEGPAEPLPVRAPEPFYSIQCFDPWPPLSLGGPLPKRIQHIASQGQS